MGDINLFVIIVLVLSYSLLFFSSFYGIYHFFVRKSPLYFKILTLSTICYTTVSLFRLVYDLCFPQDYEGMGITFLGYFGCFLFMFSANFGQYDSIIDDKTKKFRKYRIIAFAAPVVVLSMMLLYTVGNFENTSVLKNVIMLFAYSPAVLSSYYNLKHILIPDMGFKFIRWMRLINLCALVIIITEIIRAMLFYLVGFEAQCVVRLIIAFVFLMMNDFARKGRKSWLV